MVFAILCALCQCCSRKKQYRKGRHAALLLFTRHACHWPCAATTLYCILDIHLRDTTNTQRQTSDAGTSLQDCFTAVEWRAKCQVRSLSRYLPLQVSRCIIRLWFVGNEGYCIFLWSEKWGTRDMDSLCWLLEGQRSVFSLGGGRRSVGACLALFSPQQLHHLSDHQHRQAALKNNCYICSAFAPRRMRYTRHREVTIQMPLPSALGMSRKNDAELQHGGKSCQRSRVFKL